MLAFLIGVAFIVVGSSAATTIILNKKFNNRMFKIEKSLNQVIEVVANGDPEQFKLLGPAKETGSHNDVEMGYKQILYLIETLPAYERADALKTILNRKHTLNQTEFEDILSTHIPTYERTQLLKQWMKM